MAREKPARRKRRWQAACFIVGASLPAFISTVSAQAPAITGTSGTWTYGAAVTISGAGFGTKAVPSPYRWDHGQYPNLRAAWDGGWPSVGYSGACASSTVDRRFNLEYRDIPFRNTPAPHPFVTKLIAGGAAAAGKTYCDGGNVMLFVNRNDGPGTTPYYSYWSYYERYDRDWKDATELSPTLCTNWLNDPGDCDRNLKEFDFSTGVSPYDSTNWYYAWDAPGPLSGAACAGGTHTGTQLNNDSAGSGGIVGQTTTVWWGEDPGKTPFNCTWRKIEIEIKYSAGTDGFVRIWQDGVQTIDYSGRTDGYPGTARSEGIGGFNRDQSDTNWRYFADVFYDRALSRVVACEGSDYGHRGACEPQPVSSWSDGSITVNTNQGRFRGGTTAYLYVVNSDGVSNASGWPVKAVDSPPGAPTGLQIIPKKQ